MDFKRTKIVACIAKPKYRVWIEFDDGLKGEVDLSALVGKGVFEAWKDINFFNKVRVDPNSNTLLWGEDIDLDPYVLRENIELEDWIDVNDRKPSKEEEVIVKNTDGIEGIGKWYMDIYKRIFWETNLPSNNKNVTHWRFK